MSALTCHLLAYHSLDVAAVGTQLLAADARLRCALSSLSGLTEAQLSRFVPWLLAVHDLGKFSSGFQGLRPDIRAALGRKGTSSPYDTRHDALGLQLLMKEYASDESVRWRALSGGSDFECFEDVEDCILPWFTSIAGHHGKPVPATGRRTSFRRHFDDETREAVRAYLNALDQELGLAPPPIFWRTYEQEMDAARRTSWLLAGFAVLCDWLGSDVVHFPHRSAQMPLAQYFEGFALPAAEAALHASGLLSGTPADTAAFDEVFPRFQANPTQAAMVARPLSEGPSLYIIEAPTGSGKTESALHLAQRLIAEGRAYGLYFALPTMATANAMEARVREVAPKLLDGIREDDVILAHGGRQLVRLLDPERRDGDYSSDENSVSTELRRWYGDRLKKALLAPIAVGTIDQALLATLPVRHQSLRLLGLAGKVLVADEVHASDDYVHGLLRKLLGFHASLGGSAILLSATLPAKMRRELEEAFAKGLEGAPLEPDRTPQAAYPLLTERSAAGRTTVPLPVDTGSRRHLALRYGSQDSEVVDALRTLAGNGGCAAWVRNTVHDCMAGARRIRDLTPHANVFHARFMFGDRLAREREILSHFGPDSGPSERSGRILIATQVVEQSLDLDFDLVVSDLAPIDLLLQRAGRLHRHPRDENGARTEGKDRRGAPLLRVLGPPATEEPCATWYSEFFPRGAYVYDNVGELWRTGRLVWSHDEVILPDASRQWIEAVFAEDAEPPLPEALVGATARATGRAKGASWLALQMNSLSLPKGYVYEHLHWSDEQNTPTRLGEETVRLRLAQRSGNRLVPLLEPPPIGWQLSEIRVRRSRVAAETPELDADLVAAAHLSMPDEGKGTVLCEMRQKTPGFWKGHVLDCRGNTLELTYTTDLGLLFPEDMEDMP